MLCLVSPEAAVPTDHPIRSIRAIADRALDSMSRRFDRMYAETGRPSVPPERLLKGQVLMALYSIRSERQLCEQLQYNLLYRWFLGMDMMEPAFDATTYSRNRERLMAHEVVAQHQTRRRSAIDERTTRHVGYSISQQVRRRIEQVFGWAKTVAGFRRTR